MTLPVHGIGRVEKRASAIERCFFFFSSLSQIGFISRPSFVSSFLHILNFFFNNWPTQLYFTIFLGGRQRACWGPALYFVGTDWRFYTHNTACSYRVLPNKVKETITIFSLSKKRRYYIICYCAQYCSIFFSAFCFARERLFVSMYKLGTRGFSGKIREADNRVTLPFAFPLSSFPFPFPCVCVGAALPRRTIV